jgi:hypothetical protein
MVDEVESQELGTVVPVFDLGAALERDRRLGVTVKLSESPPTGWAIGSTSGAG